ncbi:MAG TPA: plasmid stabilization protein [Myxococcota bacterium]|jgi:plasmid stabilization system protein ParE
MPRGDKSAYTDKQKRQAEHIEESAKKRGVSAKRAAQIGWATVNKQDHGGKKSGSGRGTKPDHSPSKRGGEHSHTGSSYTKTGAKKKRSSKK